jgi:hypothetical protein
MERSNGTGEAITITLTAGLIRDNSLSLSGNLEFFPEEVIGGATSDDAGEPLTLLLPGLEDEVVTDIDGPKARFRERGAIRRFFAAIDPEPGQHVRIERESDRRYRVHLVDRASAPQRGPASMDELRAQFAEFSASPAEQIRVAIRRRRVNELQDLIASGDMSVEVFNQEVWAFDTATRLEGVQIPGRALFEEPLSDALLTQLERSIDGAALELHGNYIWGSGARVFGSALGPEADKDRLVADALARLRDDGLSSVERAEAIVEIPGFGPNIATGLVMVTDPTGFEIWNEASREAFGRLGLPARDLREFQRAAATLRLDLGADDFLELDWFLYQLRKGEYGGLPASAELEPASTDEVSREAVLAAIAEYDELGRDAFLERHGFGRAVKFFVVQEGELYDSKAIYGVAYGLQNPDHGTLRFDQFSGGEGTVVRHLERLGFEVRVRHEAEAAIHLLLRWSATEEPRTVERHREFAADHGAVWWGKIGDPSGRAAVAAARLRALRHQLAEEVPTYVYLHRTGEVWRTRLLEISAERPDDEAELIPEYYRGAIRQHHLWLKLAEFEQLPDDYAEAELVLDGSEDPGSITKAFKGQASLLYVREREQSPLARVWWVNQGSSLRRARAGGYLWAPQLDKAGRRKGHWEALKDARVGDLVLNFASGSIRGVSRVQAEAVEAPRPDPVADARWGEDGWLLRIAYTELSQPVPLTEIPEEWRRGEDGPFTASGSVKQGYFYPVSPEFAARLAAQFPELGLGRAPEAPMPGYEAPSFSSMVDFIKGQGMSLPTRLLRRYHLSLMTRGFVILSGISGSGKTWLAELYAEAVGASPLLVAVAPNWTTNEDLLGYLNPLSGKYQHTPFSRFLREAAEEYEVASRQGRTAKPFHLILDEMNLARVEYYFARFLSAMEVRARNGTAAIELAPGHEVLLTPNLLFTGTVNVDETTHGFADKVYDRAQLLELVVSRDDLLAHMGDAPYADQVMKIWDAVEPIAPFAFRVVDEVGAYVEHASELGVAWEEAMDEQLLQKVLPKLKGADLRLEQALADFIDASDAFPLSRDKAATMLSDFKQHGFTSFF